MAAKKRLGTVVTRNPLAARIVEFASGEAEVELDWLEAELGDARRLEIVTSLKELEEAGAGTFVVGRRGRKSRFVWSESAAAESSAAFEAAPVAPAAPAQAASPPDAPRATSPSSQPAKTLQHVFHLRPGVVTVLDLPLDITKAEVERLCGFLRAIPFE